MLRDGSTSLPNYYNVPFFRLEDSYKASSVMCRDFLEHHVKGYTLGLGSCCDHNPTFESDVTILIFKRLLMNLLAEKIHSQALPEGRLSYTKRL